MKFVVFHGYPRLAENKTEETAYRGLFCLVESGGLEPSTFRV